MSAQRLRGVAVSLSTTALDAGLFALCAALVAGPRLVLARWTCGAMGASASFFMNRRFTFDARDERWTQQAGRYLVTAAVAVSLATGIWWGLCVVTGWDPRLLHLLSLALAWLCFTFPVLRGWVFRPVAA